MLWHETKNLKIINQKALQAKRENSVKTQAFKRKTKDFKGKCFFDANIDGKIAEILRICKNIAKNYAKTIDIRRNKPYINTCMF